MNRIYKVIWNEALNCFTAVGEYAKARGKSSKSSVSANATINTTENLSSTSAFKLTAIGLGLMAAGLTMSPQVFAATGYQGGTGSGTAISDKSNRNGKCSIEANAIGDNAVAIGCNSEAGDDFTLIDRLNLNYLPRGDKPNTSSVAIGSGAVAREVGTAVGSQARAEGRSSVALGVAAYSTGNTSLAIGRQSAATADFAQALGNVSSATGQGSLAIGHSALASGKRGIAIGSTDFENSGNAGTIAGQNNVAYRATNQTKAEGQDSIAFGSGAQAIGNQSIAQGNLAEARGSQSIAQGTYAKATGNFSSAQGYFAEATESNSIAYGRDAKALGESSIAMGKGAQALYLESVAIGKGAIAKNGKAVSIGSENIANGDGAVAIGDPNIATGAGAVAIGKDNTAIGIGAIALGNESLANKDSNIALGNKAQATGNQSIAQGSHAEAVGSQSIAQGTYAKATGNFSSAQGYFAEATESNSIAYGRDAKALGENAIALGRGAIAGQSGNVALGNSSITAAQHIGNFSINNLQVAGLISGARTVSVGTVGAERQIQNVAPGVVDANSTDAINGSQLNATNNIVTTNTTNISNNTNAIAEGINFGNGTASNKFALGDFINVKGDSNITSTLTGDGVQLALADVVNIGTISPVQINGTNGTISGLTNTAFDPDSFTSGQAATEDQLSSLNTDLTNIGFNITADNKDLGPGEIEDNVKLGETVNFTNTDGNLVATVSDNGINYDLADEITLTRVTTGNTVMNDDGISIVGGSLGNNNPVRLTADGLFNGGNTIKGVGDGRVDATSNQAINGSQLFGNAQSIANSFGGGSVVNTDGTVSTPVYQVNGNDQTGVAGAIEELDKGFNLKTNGANISTVKAGDTIDIGTATGETNIEVVKTGNDIKFKLANNIDLNSVTTGNTVMDTGGITVTNPNHSDRTASLTSRGLIISNGPSVLRSGIDAGNKKITNVKAGSQPLDAVNFGQLETTNDAMNQGLNFTGDDTMAIINRQLGQTLTIKGGQDDPAELSNHANIGVVKQGQNLKIKLAKDINLGAEGSVKTGNTLVDSSGIRIINANRPNQQNRVVSLTSAGLDNGGNQITNVASGGSLTEADDQNNAANIGDVKGAITGVTELGFGIKAADGNTVQKNLGEAVEIVGSNSNIDTQVNNFTGKVEVVLNNALNLTNSGSVTTGNTVMDTGGITVTNPNHSDRTASLTSRGLIISNGPSVLRSGIDAGNKKITNVKAGSTEFDAVNFGQLETTNDAVNQGLNFTGDDTSAVINRQLGQTLTIKGGQDDPAELSNHANIGVVKQGQNLKIKLAKDINLGAEGSVKTGKTLVDNSGITIRNTNIPAKTVSLTSDGLSNGGNQITNVASGGSLTEADDQNNAANIGDVKGAITGVTELGFGIKAADGNTVQKNLGEAVEIVGSNSNIDTQVNNLTGKVEVVLNNALNLTNTGSVTTGNTVMDTGGITVTNPNHSDRTASLTSRGLIISNGPSVLRSGIDAGNKKITNVKAGSTEFDAVNFGQLETTNNAVNRGLDFTGDNSAVTINRKSGEKLTVKGGATVLATGDNIGVVADNITNTLTVKLARDLTGLNSASFGNDVMISSTGLRAGTTVVNTSGVSFSNSTVSLSSGGLNNGGKRITGVLAGEISSSSTDAVNGSQLQEVMNSAENANKGWNISAAGGPVTTVAPGTAVDFNSKDSNITVSKNAESNDISFELNRDLDLDSATFGDVSISSANGLNNGGKTITNVGDGLIEVNSKDAINGGQLKQVISNIDNSTSIINEQMNAGLNFNADNSSVIINKKLGDSALSFNGGNNITTTSAGSSIKFDLNGNINVDSVTTGDTTVSTNGVVIAGGPSITKAGIYAGNGETAPSMTAAGINAAGTKITNVADGMQPRDAVNFGQLDAVNRNLGNSINELGYRIGEVEDDANAGISAAMAMSSLPQAYIIGKSMIGGGIATYNGESAVAIGFSKLSADGRWVMKLNGTADTQGNVGAAIGAGFHFD